MADHRYSSDSHDNATERVLYLHSVRIDDNILDVLLKKESYEFSEFNTWPVSGIPVAWYVNMRVSRRMSRARDEATSSSVNPVVKENVDDLISVYLNLKSHHVISNVRFVFWLEDPFHKGSLMRRVPLPNKSHEFNFRDGNRSWGYRDFITVDKMKLTMKSSGFLMLHCKLMLEKRKPNSTAPGWSSPAWESPSYSPSSPQYSPESPGYIPTSPVYLRSPSPAFFDERFAYECVSRKRKLNQNNVEAVIDEAPPVKKVCSRIEWERQLFESLINDVDSIEEDAVPSAVTDKSFSDVAVIAKDGLRFKCHKVILSRNTILRTNFQSSLDGDDMELKIEDFDGVTVREFLRYIYLQIVLDAISIDVAEDLLLIADKYDEQELSEKCVAILLSNVNPSNACRLLLLADQAHSFALRLKCMQMIVSYKSDAVKSEYWQDVTSNAEIMTALFLADTCDQKTVRLGDIQSGCDDI